MQIVLKKSVKKLGKENDVLNVRPGFARNFLFPQGLAVPASKVAIKRAELLKTKMVQKVEEMAENAKDIASKLKSVVLKFKKKARGEKLYGSIKDTDIVDALKEQAKIEIGKDMVKIDEQIKELGEHTVKLHLTEDVDAEVKIVVEAE